MQSRRANTFALRPYKPPGKMVDHEHLQLVQ